MMIWGVSWASSKICSSYGDVYLLLFLKFFLSIVAMMPFVARDLLKVQFSKQLILIILGAIFFLIFYNYFFFLGLENGFASFGGVFVTTINPIITFLLMAVISKTKIAFLKKIALGLGVIGALLMLRIWDISIKNLFDSGNLFFLLAAFGWSMVSIISSIGSKLENSMTLTFLFLTGASFVSFFMVDSSSFVAMNSFDFIFWMNVMIAFVLTTAFATVIYFKGVAIMGPSDASSYLFLVPVFAILSSNLMLGETISLWTIMGGSFAFAALYLINKK